MEDTGATRRLAGSPAVHFVLLGALLFAGAVVWRGGDDVAERRRIEVPRYVVVETRMELRESLRRPLTPDEEAKLLRFVADEAVLFHHAKSLGLERSGAAARRLEQVASFVSANPHEAPAQAEWIEENGVDYGDRILRRILVDEAQRLIRAPALVGQPRPERIAAYYEEHRARFMTPGRTRLSHVAFARAGRTDPHGDAAAELERFRRDGVTPADAEPLGDPTAVPPALPALRDEDLDRRFGARFLEALPGLAAGRWEGPVASRDGWHLVWVHERIPPRQLELDAVERDVLAGLRQELADELYALRMRDVRSQYEVVVDGRVLDDAAGT